MQPQQQMILLSEVKVKVLTAAKQSRLHNELLRSVRIFTVVIVERTLVIFVWTSLLAHRSMSDPKEMSSHTRESYSATLMQLSSTTATL